MKNKDLADFLYKWYYKNDQRLVVDTYEDRTYDPERNSGFDVCLYDVKKKESINFLFSISNYWMFEELDRDNGENIYRKFDITKVASLPYYMDKHFFIRTWLPLTDDDIYKCTRYFIDKVLHLKYRIWNISVNPQSNAKQLKLKLYDNKTK